jgi:protein O-mannosyl-transferase
MAASMAALVVGRTKLRQNGRNAEGRSDVTRKTPPRAPGRTPDPGSAPGGPRRMLMVGAAGLLIAVTLVVYAGSFRGVFIFDDDSNILQNPNVRQLWPITRAMSAPPQSGVAGRPIIALSLAINYALGGFDPWGYHALNLVFHLLCGLLLFGMVRRTLLSPRLRERYGRSAAPLAMVVALLWLIHPLQTESVTYIITRTEVLMGFFCLWTLYCAVRGLRSARPAAWHIAAVVSCALGMGCKEVMVVTPVLVLLYDRIFESPSFAVALRRRWGLYAGLAATWIVLVALNAAAPRSASVGFAHGVTAFDYAKNQCLAIVTYLRLAVWPHPLIFDYGFPKSLSLMDVLPQGLAVLALLIVTVVAFRFWPAIGFLGAWFFIILSPTSSFIPIWTEVAAERRMYLPLAAILMLVVLAVHHLVRLMGRKLNRPRGVTTGIPLAGFIIAAVALGVTTDRRNRMYHDPVTIWEQTLAADANNARAHFGLGLALLSRGNTAEAMDQYGEALRLKPDFVEVHYNLGNALLKQGRFAEAETQYLEALKIQPDHLQAHLNLGIALVNLGRATEAIPHYEFALREASESPQTQCNLAVALANAGRVDEAIKHLREAVRLAPGDAVSRCNLAGLLLQQDQVSEAISQLNEAIRVQPRNLEARRLLGQVLARNGHPAEAAEHFREVLRLNPNDATALDGLAELTKQIKPGS